MGDIKKPSKKYKKPSHPWQKVRIDEEGKLLNEYGIKNKKQLWKMNSFLKKAKDQAKKLVAAKGPQAEKENKQLTKKLMKYGLLKTESEDVLGLTLKDVLERRLQTIVLRKNLARTISQARQFITHQHINVNGQLITSPSKLITLEEEQTIVFNPKSQFNDPMHPERIPLDELKKQLKQKKAPEETEEEKTE